MRSILFLAINLCLAYLTIVASRSSKFDLIILSAIIFVAVVGDNLLKICESDYLRAIVDSSSHGLIGLLSWSIVTLHRGHRFDRQEIVICGILASLVDIDHFFKAKSVRLKDALHLVGGRPFLHNSTLPLLILVANICIICSVGPISSRWIRFGWLLWTSFTSHHVRDANRRGLWFYPFGSTPPLSNVFYVLILLILPYLTIFLINNELYKWFKFNSINTVPMNDIVSSREGDSNIYFV